MCGCKKAKTVAPTTPTPTAFAAVGDDAPVDETVILQYKGNNPLVDMQVKTPSKANYRLGPNNIFTIFAADLATFLNMNTDSNPLFLRIA